MFTPSSSYPPTKDQSPSNSSSGSNRSSTASSNSSGYSSSGGPLQHHLQYHHHHHHRRRQQEQDIQTSIISHHSSIISPLAKKASQNCNTTLQRHSNQSTESGISTLSSSQHVISPVTLSLNSLEKKEENGCSSSMCSMGQSLQQTTDSYHQGRREAELLYSWLQSINQIDCFQLFLQSGYDMHTISRMTPEDLTAIGITVPSTRKRLANEINKLQITDGIPDFWPSSVRDWLQLIHLQCYYENLVRDNYTNIERVMDITWEDLEDIGIKQLGHQKKIILAIDKLKKIHAAKMNITASSSTSSMPTTNIIFDFENSLWSHKKNTPLTCHELIVEQIDAKNRNKEKNLFKQPKSPDIGYLKSVEIPAPEIVAIQVNRSWSVGQQQQQPLQLQHQNVANAKKNLLKYESFHGCPTKDFKNLFNDSSLVSPPHSLTEKTLIAEKTSFDSVFDYEPPPSPAPDLIPTMVSPVKMRPQVAPKPSCSQIRRASGGAEVGIDVNIDTVTSPSFVSTLKRQNSCQGIISNQQSPKNSNLKLNPHNASEPFQQKFLCNTMSTDYGNISFEASTQKLQPPAPPKRTNSIKSDLNCLSDIEDIKKLKNESTKSTNVEYCKVYSCNNSPVKLTNNNQHFLVDSPQAKLPPLARGLTRKKPVIEILENNFSSLLVAPTIVSPSPNSPTNVSFPKTTEFLSYADNNTLPFANDNIGTMKQKNSENNPSSLNCISPNDIPIKPLAKQKPQVPAKPKKKNLYMTSLTSLQSSSTASIDDDQINCDSVFDDIDNLFQGLTKELNDLLIE